MEYLWYRLRKDVGFVHHWSLRWKAVFPCGNFGGSSALSKATLERWGFPKKSPQRCFAFQQNKGESPIRGAFVGQASCLGLICFKRLDCLGFFEGNPLFEYCPPCPDVSYTGLGQKWANVSCTSEVIGHWWQFPSQWFSQWQFSTSLQCSPRTLFHWPFSISFHRFKCLGMPTDWLCGYAIYLWFLRDDSLKPLIFKDGVLHPPSGSARSGQEAKRWIFISPRSGDANLVASLQWSILILICSEAVGQSLPEIQQKVATDAVFYFPVCGVSTEGTGSQRYRILIIPNGWSLLKSGGESTNC